MRIETKTKVMSDMAGLLGTQVAECRMRPNKDTFEMRAGDAANVAVLTVVASPDVFLKYEPSEEELVVDIRKLNTVLELIENNAITIFYNDLTKKKFVVEGRKLKAGIKLLDTHSVRGWMTIPPLKYGVSASISGEDFASGVRAAAKFGEWVRFDVSSGQLSMKYEDDSIDVNNELPKTTLADFVDGTATSLYSIAYLQPLLKYLEKSFVKIEMGTNYPMRLTFKIDKSCSFEMVLAPRIETGG